MLDHLFKRRLDRFWDGLGALSARAGLRPDVVTWLGFGLSSLTSALFLVHRNPLAFGVSLAVVELLDNLDGAVARATGRKTRYGSFLDAATDRYRELFSLLAVAQVTGHWAAATLAISGSLLVSYNHARAAMEGASGTPGAFGPDLFERFERVAALCLGLVLASYVEGALLFGRDALFLTLFVIGAFSHATALQRFLRARCALRARDAAFGPL